MDESQLSKLFASGGTASTDMIKVCAFSLTPNTVQATLHMVKVWQQSSLCWLHERLQRCWLAVCVTNCVPNNGFCTQDVLEERKCTMLSFAEVMQLDGKAEGHQSIVAACRRHCTVLPDLSAL